MVSPYLELNFYGHCPIISVLIFLLIKTSLIYCLNPVSPPEKI
jgi:hypothetical protein